MANRLAAETSPYLLQHAENPVDWYPWGEEALGRARAEDLPILLSVGYSACHWCHVMERESFEDADTAAFMNANFVCVKVDREERPDVDAIYMEAVQTFTGQGGWPMTVFLDPEGVPFYGGTYFPPDTGRGMPSFRMVMEGVLEAYRGKRDEIRARAATTVGRLEALAKIEPGAVPDAVRLEDAVSTLLARADPVNGGFGSAPKFPPASALELILSREAESGRPGLGHVERTLDAMLAGGIYDQLGGGFARYAVDSAWQVPHFEKMLYDNGLLARAYLHGWQVLGHARYRRVCEETLDWLLREMRGPEGGFYSAYDADSEGEEGRFYVWTPAEIRAVLAGDGAGPAARGGRADPEAILDHYGVTEAGNFEGRNILHLANGAAAAPPEGLDAARAALLAARAERVPPGLDDKRLCSWNALAIAALAEAGAVLGRPDYLEAAETCAEFVLGTMRDADGRLLRTYVDGRAHLNAYLEDHAFMVEALLVLYEAGFDPRWFAAARELAETMVDRFGDPERGGFFSTSADHEALIARRKEVGDHPIPAGQSSAALGLLRLAALSGERAFADQALGVLALFGEPAVTHPDSFAHLLRALDFHLARTREVALVGGDLGALEEVVRSTFRPHVVVAGAPAGAVEPALLDARTEIGGEPAAYVCEGFTCNLPVTDPEALERELADLV
ncbi:MAG TPA: thioredoxin domain-containing protein [Solirubrobacterales bacterium]|nr:thioredoxin domain-containing protein [Solirubrobacterales bacterium]